MTTQTIPEQPAGGMWRQFLSIWFALAVVVALSHFALYRQMGLYEDDHWMIGVPMCDWQSTKDLLSAQKTVFTEFPQGRPLHLGFGFTLAYASTHAGGLPAAFGVAAALISLNAGLCLLLLWKRYGPAAATAASLVFVLLPADTTYPMLHAVFAVHPSLTFLLLSGLAYSRGWRLLSLVPASLTLLTYETCFLPALAWPLLFPASGRSLWLRGLAHGVAMALALMLVVQVRSHVGEARVAEALSDKREAANKAWKMATGGSEAALGAFLSRPAWTVERWSSSASLALPGPKPRVWLVVGATLVAGIAVFGANVAARRAAGGGPVNPAGRPGGDASGSCASIARLLAGGALMVILGYAAALNRAPGIEGRNSSVNIGAALGWGVLFAGFATALARLLAGVQLGWAAAPLLAAYLSTLAGFHVLVQREYCLAWSAQRDFWNDVANECPDVRHNTLILYPLGPQASSMIRDQEWADYMVFRHVFLVPPHTAAPQAFGVGFGLPVVPLDYVGYSWQEVSREGDKLFWRHWGTGLHEMEPRNVIMMRRTPEGRYERVTGTVRLCGVDFPLKPREAPVFELRPHRLYSAMFPKGLRPPANPPASASAR